jgi:hypothetical protein
MKLGDDLDRMLSSDGDIVPSSGFANSVMDAVRREAATPPAIRFPWKRVLPGVIVSVVAFVSAIILGFNQLVAAITVAPLPAAFQTRLEAAMRSPLIAESGWITLAVLLTLVSVKLSIHFVSRKSGP